MKIYPLTALQILFLLILVALVDVFMVFQKDLLPRITQPLTNLIIIILVLLAYFFLISPEEPMDAAESLSMALGVIAIVLIFLQDVILELSTISWNTASILIGAVAGPFVAGYLFAKIRGSVTES